MAIVLRGGDLTVDSRYNPLADVSRMPSIFQDEARASIIMSVQELQLTMRPRSDRALVAEENSDSDDNRDSVMMDNPMIELPPPPSPPGSTGSPGSPSPPALRPYSGRKVMGRPTNTQINLSSNLTSTGDQPLPSPPSSPFGSPLLRPFSGIRSLSARLTHANTQTEGDLL